jgi:hypothetical protein
MAEIAGDTAATNHRLEPRSEEDVLANAGLAVTVGGVRKSIRALPIKANRDWKELLAERARHLIDGIPVESDDWGAVIQAVSGSTELMLELVLAYDRDAALGGREWLESHATDAEIYAAFKTVMVAAFPFLRDAGLYPALVGTLLQTLLGRRSESSTSSPSADGDTGARRNSKKP